jgi:regulator of sirC expression with transglutaminase-like and TPR domain
MGLLMPTATPLSYFSSLVATDSGLNLTEAAVSLAQDEHPGLDVQTTLADLDELAQRLRGRLALDASPTHRLLLLTRFFYGEMGFGGNLNDFYDPANSFVHRVLTTRRGIPISLSVLLLELASQIGLRASGVAFPGHFLVKFRIGMGEVVIDPFTGDTLSAARLDERLQVYRQGSGLPSDLDLPLEFFLRAATPRQILARMLRNLKEIYRAAQDAPRWLAVQQRLVILLPDEPSERRDRGLALQALGAWAAAADDLSDYLARQPQPADGAELRALLAQLRERGHPPLQ